MLDRILKRADFLDGSTFSADEVARWPLGALDHLLAVGLIREIAPADGLVCDQCEEGCWIKPEVREDPRTGKRVGRYFCRTNEDVGPFTVDLERQRQWEVHTRGLAEAVAKALSATGGVQEIVSERMYWLGRILLNGKSREVILGRGLAWPDALGMLGQARRLRSAHAAIVLVPSTVPPDEIWNGLVPTVRALTEIASTCATGLTIASAHFLEEAVGGKPGVPRKMIRGWKDICAALNVPYAERRSVKLLNQTQSGPIRSLGKGKKPEAWSDELNKWWEDQEGRHQALRKRQESAHATASDSFLYGPKGETVIPGVSMHVRKRRKGQGGPRNDNV